MAQGFRGRGMGSLSYGETDVRRGLCSEFAETYFLYAMSLIVESFSSVTPQAV
jgi:hypothetical protein